MAERHLALLTPDSAPRRPTHVAAFESGLDLVDSFAELAISLPWPHGPSTCGCLVCADARARVGMAPGEPDYADLFGARWMP